MLQPTIVEKAVFTVVGCQQTFIHALSPEANNLNVLDALWERFCDRDREVSNRIGTESYGIIFERPKESRKHPHELEYIAGVRVSVAATIPDGMLCFTIPAATFAVFVHKGPIKNIGTTAQRIYRVWLPSSGYVRSGPVDVELYDQRFCVDGAESEMEYWVPVVAKSK